MIVEVLYCDGCPGHEGLLPRLHAHLAELHIDADVVVRRIATPEAAELERFLGSPTIRLDGRDIDPAAAGRTDYGLKCRLYPSEQGLGGDIPDELIRGALTRGDT